MKNKAKFLIKQSLKKKMDTKWFKIVNILLLVLLVGVLNIDSIINKFGGDFEKPRMIYVLDEVNCFEVFKENFLETTKHMENISKFELTSISADKYNETKDNLTDTTDVLVTIKPSSNYMEASIVSYQSLGTITETVITSTLNNTKQSLALINSGINQEELMQVMSTININKEVISDNNESQDILSAGALTIFLVPFFILIVLLVQMIGAEINDEKTTRSMEIIISNVSPKVHFATKIISSTIFVLTQSILLIIYALVGLAIRFLLGNGLSADMTSSFGLELSSLFTAIKDSGALDIIMRGLPLFIILAVGSFLAYALLAGILASMTTSIEDFQQLQTPLMFLLMAGYYVGIMASLFEGSIFIKIIGYIPFISILVAPITYILGQTTLLDLGISVILLIFMCYLLFKYGIRLYKVGILNYSSKDLWKKVFKSLRKKESYE